MGACEVTLTDLTQGPLPQPISITFSAAACGAGETFWATGFAGVPQLASRNFVFALDRIDEFAARRQMLLDGFAEIGRPPWDRSDPCSEHQRGDTGDPGLPEGVPGANHPVHHPRRPPVVGSVCLPRLASCDR